jgi:glycosyltransferase involved in cell wall biosynthesis
MNLSVIIPARNEMFLNYTVNNVLENSDEGTEVIAILDGEWPEVPLPQHDRLKVIFFPKSIGQRAAINQGVRISRAKYIMKLDAHCKVEKGFDAVLIRSAQELGREVTQIPRQYNLHAFDWVCPDGHRRYQGPSGPCKDCGKETKRDIKMNIRDNRLTTRWRFDKNLHFQYWGTRDKGPYIETMSLLGACWFLDREWYWELGGSDEAHGSWGQQGTEIACKTWLSGGRLITNMQTWFSHMFRTQGGDFSFPYQMRGSDQEKAKQYSRDLWLNDRWPKAKRPLQWIIDHFQPPDWV